MLYRIIRNRNSKYYKSASELKRRCGWRIDSVSEGVLEVAIASAGIAAVQSGTVVLRQLIWQDGVLEAEVGGLDAAAAVFGSAK